MIKRIDSKSLSKIILAITILLSSFMAIVTTCAFSASISINAIISFQGGLTITLANSQANTNGITITNDGASTLTVHFVDGAFKYGTYVLTDSALTTLANATFKIESEVSSDYYWQILFTDYGSTINGVVTITSSGWSTDTTHCFLASGGVDVERSLADYIDQIALPEAGSYNIDNETAFKLEINARYYTYGTVES